MFQIYCLLVPSYSYSEEISTHTHTRAPAAAAAAAVPPRRPPQIKAGGGGILHLLLRLVVILPVVGRLSCCRPFEDEEPERLEAEVDEAPLAVREVAAEAGADHALPSGAMDRVKLLQASQIQPQLVSRAA